MFRGRIGTIGVKQVENQMKPNKCDFCTLLIMLYFCTENERNLLSIENRPVGFYTECLLKLTSYLHDVLCASWEVSLLRFYACLRVSTVLNNRSLGFCNYYNGNVITRQLFYLFAHVLTADLALLVFRLVPSRS